MAKGSTSKKDVTKTSLQTTRTEKNKISKKARYDKWLEKQKAKHEVKRAAGIKMGIINKEQVNTWH